MTDPSFADILDRGCCVCLAAIAITFGPITSRGDQHRSHAKICTVLLGTITIRKFGDVPDDPNAL